MSKILNLGSDVSILREMLSRSTWQPVDVPYLNIPLADVLPLVDKTIEPARTLRDFLKSRDEEAWQIKKCRKPALSFQAQLGYNLFGIEAPANLGARERFSAFFTKELKEKRAAKGGKLSTTDIALIYSVQAKLYAETVKLVREGMSVEEAISKKVLDNNKHAFWGWKIGRIAKSK